MSDQNEQQGLVGQNPYTDPPPMERRRFYEDPQPPNEASEQQVLQGRGEPAPYPADEPYERGWQPERYPDQQSAQRPEDSAQPSVAESLGSGMTLARLFALPREQQDTIIEQLRAQHDAPGGAFEALQGIAREEQEQRSQTASRANASQPSQPSGENPDWDWSEERRQWVPARRRQPSPNPQQGSGAGVQRMAPASPGTVIAGEHPAERDRGGDDGATRDRRGSPDADQSRR